MPTDVIVAAGSAVIIAFLGALAWLMGFRQSARLDLQTLQNELAAAEPNARLGEAVFAANGRAAIAKLADGRVLTARVMADGVALRIVRADAARFSMRKGKAIVAFADVGYPRLTLPLSEAAPDWLQTLAGERT